LLLTKSVRKGGLCDILLHCAPPVLLDEPVRVRVSAWHPDGLLVVLNIRVAPMLGGLHTTEDLEVLWLDEPADELRDKDIVRRWVAAKNRGT
jgi:hypothetical protein